LRSSATRGGQVTGEFVQRSTSFYSVRFPFSKRTKGPSEPQIINFMVGYDDFAIGIESETPSSTTVDKIYEKDSSALSTHHGLVFYLLIIVSAPILAILLQVLASGSGRNGNIQVARNSSSFHHRRRFQHILTGVLFYCLSYVLSQFVAALILAIATVVFYGLHKARSVSKSVQEHYMKHFGPLLRDHEKNLDTLPGAFWFLLGTCIVVSSFDMNIARTSLLCLSFGDPIAAMAGIRFGGPKIFMYGGSKSAVGCSACFWTCFLVAFFCMNDFGVEVWFLTGSVATIMEAFSCAIDDNFLIPVGTGTALWLYTSRAQV